MSRSIHRLLALVFAAALFAAACGNDSNGDDSGGSNGDGDRDPEQSESVGYTSYLLTQDDLEALGDPYAELELAPAFETDSFGELCGDSLDEAVTDDRLVGGADVSPLSDSAGNVSITETVWEFETEEAADAFLATIDEVVASCTAFTRAEAEFVVVAPVEVVGVDGPVLTTEIGGFFEEATLYLRSGAIVAKLSVWGSEIGSPALAPDNLDALVAAAERRLLDAAGERS